MDYQKSLEYLYGLGHETSAMKFGLQNTETLLAALGAPQQSFIKIQIAGTNGKGSTCAFLNQILRRANLNVGFYTSPHLINVTERIKINNCAISQTDFAALATTVRETAENLVKTKQLDALPTFFEQLTVIALLAFRRAKVDLAILETGLGGRLDATTAALAEIAGITAIALDHQEYLGDTIEKIAQEKAAIIHSETRAAVVANQSAEALRVIAERCREVGITPTPAAQIIKSNRRENSQNLAVSFKTAARVYPNVALSLLGRHQLENAATAIGLAEAVRDLNFKISPEDVCAGLENAVHFGRLEFRTIKNRTVLFDGAHNQHGARALKDFILEFFPNARLTIVFGAMRDKDLTEIGAEIFPLADKLILTAVDNPRSAAPVDLQKIAIQTIESSKINVAANFREAWHIAQNSNDLIVITGSLYLVGEAQKFFGVSKQNQ